MDWGRTHPGVSAALVFTVILLGFFFPMLIGKQVSQQHILWAEWPWRGFAPTDLKAPINANEGDEAHTFYPLGLVARQQVRNGEIPLWNPYSYGGHVLLGDQQSALLFPLTWIGFLLPLAWAWGPILLLKLLMAAMGVYAFARGIGLRWWSSVFAGTVFMLSAPMLGWLQWPHSTVFALVGWLFLATHRLMRSGSWQDFGWVSLVVGLSIFAGHPESAILNSLAGFTYAGVLLIADRRIRGGTAAAFRKLGMYIATQGMGLVAAGAAVMPFYEAFVLSVEKTAHKYQATPWLDPWDVLLYLMPDLYGRPGAWPVVGRLDFLFTSTLVDFSTIATILAAIGLWRLRARAEAKALAMVAFVSAILMFDIFPADHLMAIPPLNTVIVQRVYVYIALVGAVLAGAALASLLERPFRVREAIGWTAVPFVGAMGLLLIEIALNVTYGPEAIINDTAILRFAAALVMTAVALILIGRVRSQFAIAAVIGACVVQLAYHTDLNIWLPPSQAHPATPPSISYIQSKQKYPGQFRIGTIRIGTEMTLFQSNAAAMYGLESLEGHDPPISKRWVAVATGPLDQPGYLERLPGGPDPRNPKALNVIRAMNVKYFLTRPYARYSIPGMVEVYRGDDAVVYEDKGVLPRAYVVPGVKRMSPIFARKAMREGKFYPRSRAIVPTSAPSIEGTPGFYRAAKAEWVSGRTMKISVPKGGAGWLVIGNPWAPEWKATVDGKQRRLYPTNYAMMGLPLKSGSHEITITYSSTGFWTGVSMSVVGLGAIALMIVGGRRRWRPRRWVEARTGRQIPIPNWAIGPGDVPPEGAPLPPPGRLALAYGRFKASVRAAVSRSPAERD